MEHKKTAVITIRIYPNNRKFIERIAKKEGRTVSQIAHRMLLKGMASEMTVGGR